MATVLLLHSVLGLRAVEREWAETFRAAGHRVTTPDLFDGPVAGSIDEGFAIRERLGADEIMRRAREAAALLPPDAVLSGLSFGAGVASDLWAERPETAGVLLFHGIGPVPDNARRGTPAQMHLADPDPFEDAEWVDYWRKATAERGIAADLHLYPGPGHLFTDASLPDHDPDAAALCRERALAFLASLDTPNDERPPR